MKELIKKNSVVAFLDILGYKDLIKSDSVEKEIEIFNSLKKTIDISLTASIESIILTFKHLDKKYEGNISERINSKQFSDNIYFSFDYEEQENNEDLLFSIYIVTNISALYQRLMLGKGYYIRGGIAHGLNMVDKNFIFSHALIDAVEVEKATIYPRITFHSDLRKIFMTYSNDVFKQITHGLYVQDWSENIFLNPFNHTSRNKKIIEDLPQEGINEINEVMSKQEKIIKKNQQRVLEFIDG